jgi:AcrR family transcriptional regulator
MRPNGRKTGRAATTKGAHTRARIVAKAAPLFNQRGYAGAAMSDVMAATGLEKGGIYRHFESKDALALAAFEYAVRVHGRRLLASVEAAGTAADRLSALVTSFATIADDPPVPGGCPVLNMAVESDDTHPALRDAARRAMDGFRALVVRIVRDGVRAGELAPGTDGDELASVSIATLEGALVLSRLYGDPVHMRRAERHLLALVRALLPPAAAAEAR